MNSMTLKSIAAMIMFTSLAIPIRAQEPKEKQTHYSATNLGTLGGVLGSSAHSINSEGWIAGVANLLGDTVEHAALWRDGVVTDLGTLGGDNSNVDFSRGSISQAATRKSSPTASSRRAKCWNYIFSCGVLPLRHFSGREETEWPHQPDLHRCSIPGWRCPEPRRRADSRRAACGLRIGLTT
jgi:probable HAF family extracellular repeat protein